MKKRAVFFLLLLLISSFTSTVEGQQITLIPPEYQQVEWIQSDGNQAINTKISAKVGYRIETDVAFMGIWPNDIDFVQGGIKDFEDVFIGAESNLNSYMTFAVTHSKYCANSWLVGGGNGSTAFQCVGINQGQRYNFYTEYLPTSYMFKMDGNVLFHKTGNNTVSTNFNTNLPLHIFSNNYLNRPAYTNQSIARTWGVKIWEYDTPVRDFVPCYRKSDGAIGLWDLITCEFYPNIGRGSFTKGNNNTEYISVYDAHCIPQQDINVTKVWDDNSNTSLRPNSISFNLYGNGSLTPGSPYTISSNNWKTTVPKMPIYTGWDQASQINYSIAEINVSNNYQSVLSGSNPNFIITNKYAKKNLNISIDWSDFNNRHDTRPNNVVVEAYIGDTAVAEGSCTATSQGWTCTINQLSIYDSSGDPIIYTVKERSVSGYTSTTTSVNLVETTSATIENDLLTKSILVKKNWSDDSNRDRIRPLTILVSLYQDDELLLSTTLSAAENSVSADLWTYTFDDLPIYKKNGDMFVYSVREKPSE